MLRVGFAKVSSSPVEFKAIINLSDDNVQAQYMRKKVCRDKDGFTMLDDGTRLPLVVEVRKLEWNYITYGSQ